MKNSKDYSNNSQTTASYMADFIWSAADKMRGFLNVTDYSQYILSFFFFKYISDLCKDSSFKENNSGNNNLLSCRFIIPENKDFETVRRYSLNPEFSGILYNAFRDIEQANNKKLDGIFSSIGIYDLNRFSDIHSYESILRSLLDIFSEINFQPSVIDNNIVAECFELLLEKLSWHGGKKGGYANTPYEVANLLKLLLEPQEEDTIYDPACGYGGLLTHFGSKKNCGVTLYGQELNHVTYNIARMNMFIHCLDDVNIQHGDSINDPKLIENNTLRKFDIVVSNPPFSVDHWWRNGFEYGMFKWGMPPENKGDYAFISHMLTASATQNGRVGIVVSHGTLFRQGQEQDIRRRIIKDNLLDAVIGLPANLLTATSIPVAILLFSKKRNKKQSVLFIDASREFSQSRRKNFLTPEGIRRIILTYQSFKNDPCVNGKAVKDNFSYVASIDEIAKNDYNINLERYVRVYDQKQDIDIEKLELEIIQLDNKLNDLRTKIKKNLSDLE